MQASSPQRLSGDAEAMAAPSPADGVSSAGRAFPSPDWPSARRVFPNWLWSGLVPDKSSGKMGTEFAERPGGLDSAALDHARGRCYAIGEFFLLSMRLLDTRFLGVIGYAVVARF